MKRAALALTITPLIAIIGFAAPAHAMKDTTWGCPTCIVAHPHHR